MTSSCSRSQSGTSLSRDVTRLTVREDAARGSAAASWNGDGCMSLSTATFRAETNCSGSKRIQPLVRGRRAAVDSAQPFRASCCLTTARCGAK